MISLARTRPARRKDVMPDDPGPAPAPPPTPHPGAASARDARFRVMNWIGIVNQLSVTRANRLLEAGNLPFPQFTLLLHLSAQSHRRHSVTDVAQAFQQPQPGITKTLQKLEEKGLVAAEPHATDRRVRLFAITPAGSAALARSTASLEPLLDWLFAEWDSAALARLFADLDRLKVRLDENRD